MENLLNRPPVRKLLAATVPHRRLAGWGVAIALLLWVVLGFGLARWLVVAVAVGLQSAGVPLRGVDPSVLNAVGAAIAYMLAITIVVGVPWWLKKRPTTLQDLGLGRLPSWTDILLTPAAFIIYLPVSLLLGWAAQSFMPGFEINQVQPTGFSYLGHYYEYVLAFVTLVVIGPLAEETLFRGYLYGKLRHSVPVWAAVLATSLLFAAVHSQWNVALDVFVLSLVLCGLREVTGSIWAGVLLHMAKNGVAFYLLFINPMFLHTIGG